MEKWKCVDVGDGSWRFSLGAVYRTNQRGELVDSELLCRLKPTAYNASPHKKVPKFVKVVTNLENK